MARTRLLQSSSFFGLHIASSEIGQVDTRLLQSSSCLVLLRNDGAWQRWGVKKLVARPPTFLPPAPECAPSLRTDGGGEAISCLLRELDSSAISMQRRRRSDLVSFAGAGFLCNKYATQEVKQSRVFCGRWIPVQ